MAEKVILAIWECDGLTSLSINNDPAQLRAVSSHRTPGGWILYSMIVYPIPISKYRFTWFAINYKQISCSHTSSLDENPKEILYAGG